MTGRNMMAALALATALSAGAFAQNPSDKDTAQRFVGAYCAQFEVHAQEGFVTYTEDLDINPRTVGVVRKRWFAFDGPDRLKLTIDAVERQANLQDSSLIWERVRNK